MHNYTFDAETNGILLLDQEINPVACKEPRPVYAEEMNLLEFNARYKYPAECNAPLMWAERRNYFYKGLKLASLKGSEFVTKPELMDEGSIFANDVLQPCNIPLMIDKNRALITALADSAIERVKKYYNEYKNKTNAIWVSFSGGKDSMVLLDIVQRALPHDAFKVFFTNTHMEFPDTYDYIDRIRVWCADRNIDFIVCQSDMLPEDSWHLFGPPCSYIRWCCSVHKSAPQQLKAREIYGRIGMKVFSFVGCRASESLARSKYDFLAKGKKHTGQDSLNPILDWNSAEVWLYTYMRNLPINLAYRKGNNRVGCILCPGGTKLREYIASRCYPEMYQKFYQYLKDTYDPKVLYTGDINDPHLGKIWVARKNGNGLLIPCNYEDQRQNDTWVFTLTKVRTDWREWIKTIGILLNDKSPYQIRFRKGVYSFTVQPLAGGGLDVRTTDLHTRECKSFIKMLKQVFRKAACCVMCRVCEADCPFGCLKMKDGKIAISDDCRHCSCCHHAKAGCYIYHSTWKRRNGKYYYMVHKDEKDNVKL